MLSLLSLSPPWVVIILIRIVSSYFASIVSYSPAPTELPLPYFSDAESESESESDADADARSDIGSKVERDSSSRISAVYAMDDRTDIKSVSASFPIMVKPVKKEKVCAFFGRGVGCMKGDKCNFRHVMSPDVQDSSKKKAKYVPALPYIPSPMHGKKHFAA